MIAAREASAARVRALLTGVAAVCAACGGSGTPPTRPAAPAAQPALPITGEPVAGMASVDEAISTLMRRWEIPGGAVGVVKDGRLVYARGFGYSDAAAGEAVAPDALFRIASVSKPITGVAVAKLVEDGRLDLDAGAFALLADLAPPPGAARDPRLASITVRQLLHHAGGWDRDRSFDPMFRTTEAPATPGTPIPAGAETIIRYMLGRPLDFDPGSRYAYSNFGYAVLGEIIERAAGTSYEQYVTGAVLAPMGIRRMRLGGSLPGARAPGEVRYYDPGTATSVFPGGERVPFPYGGFHLEAMDAHGGWIASAADLLRFVTAVDGLPTRPDVLRRATIDTMTARPPAPLWEGSPVYYAQGWLVRPAEGNWWHDGSLPGTASIVVRTGGGLAWVALFNARAMLPGSAFEAQIDGAMWRAVRGVTAWPAHDLFARYP